MFYNQRFNKSASKRSAARRPEFGDCSKHPLRAAIYARYSSDNQREESISDQIEVCRRYCTQQGWDVVASFDDAALSGSSTMLRPGYQRMVLAADARAFDVVVCEAVDRLSRRLSDVAALHDRLNFRGVVVHVPSIGILTTMHIGIMGMMAQIQLADLGEKTKRGQAGRVRAGRIPAGLAYGYEVVPPPPGCKEAGERRIVDAEAAVVVRIFRDYAAGVAPRQLARRLNNENVAGPGGRPWLETTIRGQPDRGTGILNNRLYVGELVWNRCSYVKNPTTGRREPRLNPAEQWERQKVPKLRIVDPMLWEAVRNRQAMFLINPAVGKISLNGTHRRRFVLSGLVRCVSCNGPYTVMAKDRYGCATHTKSARCSNSRTISRTVLERRVLGALQDKMLAPDVAAASIVAFENEVSAARAIETLRAAAQKAEVEEIKRKISSLIDAIEQGAWSASLQERLSMLEQRQREIKLAEYKEEFISKIVMAIGPASLELYRSRVAELVKALSATEAQAEAAEALRMLIHQIVLTPDDTAPDRHHIKLHGNFAAALAMAHSSDGGSAQRCNEPLGLSPHLLSTRLSLVA